MNKKYFYTLISFYKPYRGLFIADLFSALTASGIALVLPLGVRYIADHLLESGLNQPTRILWAGLTLAALVLVQALCSYFLDYQGHYLGAKIERDMRAQMFRHCEKLSFSYYDDHTVGDLMSRITSDSLSLAEFFHHTPEDILVNVIKFTGAAVILLTIHWQTALVILVLIPFMVFYTLHFNKKMNVAMRQARESMSGINSQVEDSLSGIRVVQSFANEELEYDKFSRQNQRFLEDRRAGYRSEAGAHEFIERLDGGYDADIGPHGIRLSGGQQQRLSIARVFLKNPPVLIFDEATSALDTCSEKIIQRSLEELAQQRTTLVIAHRLSTISGAGCILVLDENGICERGTHQELMAHGGVYADLYRSSMEF